MLLLELLACRELRSPLLTILVLCPFVSTHDKSLASDFSFLQVLGSFF